MKCYIYVDNANFELEGCAVSAVSKEQVSNTAVAVSYGILDRGWRPDYGKLHNILCGVNQAEVGAAQLWGLPAEGDSFWELVRQQGFAHKFHDPGDFGKERKVDGELARAMKEDAQSIIDKADSEICLVAGDRELAPAVQDLVAEGFRVRVAFWEQAPQELKDACTSFTSLDPHLDDLAFKK